MDTSQFDQLLNNTEAALKQYEEKLNNTPSHRVDKERRSVRNCLVATRSDVAQLDSTLRSWRENPRPPVSQGELMKRAEALTELQLHLARVETMVQDPLGGGSDRDPLLGQGRYDTAASVRRHYEENDETRYMDNRTLLQQQHERIQQDDAALERISIGLGQLKTAGLQQQKQLVKQDAMLDELKQGVDNTDARLQSNIKRVDLIEEGSRGGCCALIVILLLLALIVSVLASNWLCSILPHTKKRC